MAENNPESEEVLMTIMYNPIFGHGKMVVFQLVEWIKDFTKSSEAVHKVDCRDRLAFAVAAKPTRHEVTCKSDDREYNHC